MKDKMLHPFIKYAQALIMVENNLTNCKEITADQIKNEIERGLNSFRVKPCSVFDGKTSVSYTFCKEEKGNTDKGIFLSANIVTTDKSASATWKNGKELIQILSEGKRSLDSSEKMTMSAVPIAGDYLSFSETNASKRNALVSLFDKALGTITTLTQIKPCLVSTSDWTNTCLIPDLPIRELKDFISFFKRLLLTKAISNLMIGNVELVPTGKGLNTTIKYKPKRPLIFKGNFPDPPKSSVLGAVTLLGAIGEFAKEAEYSEQAKRVLDSLKGTEIYLIKYGNAKVFTYNHHVIDLAKESKLKTIVDSLYYSKLYNQDRRSGTNTEYQKFDLFTSRFLQLFNHAAFKDFLAFRAEYTNEVTTLFNTYFIKMEKIDSEIVGSARILGKWLNLVAFFAAKNEIKEGIPNYWEELRKMKAKVLVELESSTFSAKSGNALIAQAVTRAGRLSGMDTPEGATLFMEKTASGELPLDDAKNLLIAFSRLINKSEKKEKKNAGIDIVAEGEDLSNA